MNAFWEQSPLWQRQEELYAEVDAAKEAMEEAGRALLWLVEIDADAASGREWQARRQAYLDAVEVFQAVGSAWAAASRAFKASPVGQARARYFADPLTYRAPEAEELETA